MTSIRAFIDHLKTVKRFSAHTLSAYEADLISILGDTPYNALSTADVESWITTQRTEEHIAPSSINRALSALRSYYKWLKSAHGYDAPKLRTLKNIKAPAPHIHASSMNTLEKFIDGVKDHQHKEAWRDARNITLVALLYATGLRVSEAQALVWHNIQGDMLHVKDGKGGKERHVPLLPKVRHILSTWEQQSPLSHAQTPLFISNEAGNALTTRRMQQIFKETCSLYGIDDALTPHTMRHNFATHLLQNGANIREVQDLLGHSHLATTQRYLTADLDYLRSIHNKAHPLEENDRSSQKIPQTKSHKSV